jgi:hypothetical protein
MKFIYSIVLLLISTQILAANITVRVSHDPVSMDESFHLIYEADSSVDDDPDFSVLTKDFEILSSSQSTNMRMINGNWSLKKSWDLTLISKEAGVFTIPPIPFGKDKSPSLRVTVKPSGSQNIPDTGTSSSINPLFVDVKTDTKSTWVQSEIIYTVKLFSTLRISRLLADAVETSDPDAIITPLGNGSSYETSINGVRYAVYEMRYAIYPQHSGKLTIKPFQFEGRIADTRSQSLFDQFMLPGKLKRIRSKSTSVNVKARPANIAAAAWLPAEQLTATDEWSEDINQLRTGEPVTRTITLTAIGQTAEQLPDITLADIPDLKQYPDKPILENDIKHDGVTGSRQIKIAIIPTQAGKYIIPEVRIPWFDTRTGKQNVISLPEVAIAATGKANTIPVQLPEIVTAPVQQPVITQQKTETGPLEVKNAGYWPWISLALAIGWIVTTVLYFRGNDRKRSSPESIPAPSITPLEKAVENACASGIAQNTKDALIAWALVLWPDHSVTSLSEIAQRVKTVAPELSLQVESLNSSLYSPHSQSWDHRALQRAFSKYKPNAGGKQKNEAPVMQPLYRT